MKRLLSLLLFAPLLALAGPIYVPATNGVAWRNTTNVFGAKYDKYDIDLAGAADSKIWRTHVDSSRIDLGVVNDSLTQSNEFLTIQRSGTNVSSITLRAIGDATDSILQLVTGAPAAISPNGLGVTGEFTANSGITWLGGLNPGAWRLFGFSLGNTASDIAVAAGESIRMNDAGDGFQAYSPGADKSITAAGTAATINNSDAILNFGTTDPTTAALDTARYMFIASGTLKYTAATFAAAQTCTVTVKNQTPTVQETQVVQLGIRTTITDGAGTFSLSGVYEATSGDTLSIYAVLSANPGAGSLDCASAKLTVVRIR